MSCQHDFLSIQRNVSSTPGQHGAVSSDVVSRRCRRETTLCKDGHSVKKTVSRQNDVVSKRCRDNKASCRDDTMSRRRRVNTVPCQHIVVSKRCPTHYTISYQNNIVPTWRRANTKSPQHDALPTGACVGTASYQKGRRANTPSCKYYLCFFSKWCLFKTMPNQYCVVSR